VKKQEDQQAVVQNSGHRTPCDLRWSDRHIVEDLIAALITRNVTFPPGRLEVVVLFLPGKAWTAKSGSVKLHTVR
jgi:hypothetical protein